LAAAKEGRAGGRVTQRRTESGTQPQADIALCGIHCDEPLFVGLVRPRAGIDWRSSCYQTRAPFQQQKIRATMPLHSPRGAALAGLFSLVLGQLALHAGEGFASMLLSRVSLPASDQSAPQRKELV